MLYIMAILIGALALAPIILTLGQKQLGEGIAFGLVIGNLATTSLGWTVGMKIGWNVGGTWGALVGLFGTVTLCAFALVLSDDLAS
jgi:hypothetical protein